MKSTNAVMDTASHCRTPAMIMMIVGTSLMSLAVVSNSDWRSFLGSWHHKNVGLDFLQTFLLLDRGSTHTCSDNICEHNCTDLKEGGLLCSCRPGYKPRATEKHMCEGRAHNLS